MLMTIKAAIENSIENVIITCTNMNHPDIVFIFVCFCKQQSHYYMIILDNLIITWLKPITNIMIFWIINPTTTSECFIILIWWMSIFLW